MCHTFCRTETDRRTEGRTDGRTERKPIYSPPRFHGRVLISAKFKFLTKRLKMTNTGRDS